MPNGQTTYIPIVLQGDVNHVIAQAKVATIDNLCTQAACAQPCKVAQHQAKEADVQALSDLKRALDKKVFLNLLCSQINTFCAVHLESFTFSFHVPFSFRQFINLI